MDLAQRLSLLESVHDWHALAEELEKAIASESDASVKAAHHLRLGRVLDERFLQGVKALKHFQDAYKLSPTLVEALERARGIYWELGKTPMVQKLLDIELRTVNEGPEGVALLIELGDVLTDAGDVERATATYARALGVSNGQSDDARAGLADAQVDETSWQAHVGELVGQAQSQDGPEACRTYLRAARVARRFDGEFQPLLARAYDANPLDRQAAALFEGLLAGDQAAQLEQTQTAYLDSLTARGRAVAAFRFGARWATRHQNLEVGAKFLEDALSNDPHLDAALSFLRDLWGARDENWDRVLGIAERAAGSANPSPFAIAQSGLVAWRQLGNLMRARSWFAKLDAVAPDHQAIAAFEQQIGESVTAAADAPLVSPLPSASPPPPQDAEDTAGVDVDVAVSEPPPADEPAAAAPASEPPLVAEPEPAESPEVLAAPDERVSEPAAEPPPAPAPAAVSQPAPARETPAADPARVAELRAKLEKLQAAKRMTEYVKTLVELADAVDDPDDKVALYLEAAELYTTKFPNAAEAVKCFEAVLAIDENNQTAIDHLRATYEKRRDWEKLIGLMRREASALPNGPDRSGKFLEIARLANERVKKPEVCIDLWNEVIESDPENPEALGALAGLYERSKEWSKLAEVLERQAEVAPEEATYKKLGQLYGDRLGDDQKAVDAWRKLLAMNPGERSAQEALKKKYIALGQWDDLEVFYAESGKWDEFIRLLEAQESKESDEKAKISLLVKTAQLWVTQKGKLDRAARAYEKVLALDPQHLGAAESLIPIYQQANNPKGLASAIEVKLKSDVEPEERLALLREVAALYEGRLKEPNRAFERYLTAFELMPNDPQTIEDVERAARATGGWESLVGSYRASIASAQENRDSELEVALRLRLGRVLVDEVQRIDDALEQFRAVYDADGENATAITALERLYRDTGRHSELLGIYEKKRDLAGEPADRRAILFSIATLYENELKNPRSAIDTYRQVLEETDRDPDALAALDRLYRELEDWEPYVEVLRARIENDVPEEALIDLKYRLGTTLEKHLSDPAGALENYREILFLDPSNEPARLALENLLENRDLRAETAAILQEIYEARGDWAKLVGALEILAETEADASRRVALLRKVARVCAENLEDLGKAIDAQARALKEDPTSTDARLELEQLAEQAGAWDKLDQILSEIAETLDDPQLAREYWMRLASIDERLGKVDEAAQGYQKVLGIDASDPGALAAMEALYRRTERWEDLIGVFRRRIDLAEDVSQREALYGQMASVYEERLGRPEDAIAAYREVLAIEPTSALALGALDGLFTRQGKWEELAENLESQLGLAESEDEQTRLMLRLADLRETKMSQVETAIDIYRQVLDRDPNNEPALGSLERLGQVAEHELAIADILEPLYRQAGDWQRLIGVYEVQVRRSDDPGRRVELLHQISSLYEDAGGDLDSAFTTMARALAEDPTSEATKEGLDRLARATGRFAELAKVFEERAAAQMVGAGGDDDATAVTDPTVAVDLFTIAARVYEEDLGAIDPAWIEKAVAHYTRVLEIDPMNLFAAESLERIFRTAERYAELSVALSKKADILEALPDKKAALFQAASIEEDVLERPEAAIGVYRKILELDSEDLRGIDALIKLYLAHSRWADLLGVYTQKADLVLDHEEKKNIYYQVGAVYERELRDVPQAIDTYSRILELDPDDLQALSRLDVLYQMAENWAELLTILQHEAELADDPAESISYQYRIAELYEKKLDDLTRAIELYRDLLQQMPDHAPTLEALEGIKRGPREALAAALVLEPIYDATGEWKRLVSVLEVQASHAEDTFGKVDLLHRIARLEEEMLGDYAAAFAVYARAVSLDVTNEESLSSFERLAMAVGRWAEVATLYDVELAKLREEQPERFVELGLRLAQIFETQLEDVDSAIHRYRLVLEVDPENWQAMSSLDRLLVMTERWSDLVGVLAREADIGQTPDDILTFKFRLGQVHQHHLKDLKSAINSYREVLAAAPEHVPTLEALEGLFAQGLHQLEIGEILEPLYQTSGDWEKLSAVLEAVLAQTTERDDRLAMYYRIAELQEERLIALEGALEVYIRALKEYPTDEKTLEECERLAETVDGGWEALANAYADVLELHNDKAVQAAIGKRLARVFEESLGDIANAEKTYRYVLGVEALDVDALAQLDRIYSSLEQYPELAQVLEQRLLATKEQSELIDLHLRLGEVYEQRLIDENGVGQLDDAIRIYRRVFDELDPPNEPTSSALERIYGQKQDWNALKVVLERQLEHASGDSEEAEIRAKMANLLADRLGDVPGAIETWKRVLDLRGDDPEALHGLANLYEGSQQWGELTEVLGRHYDIAIEDDDRVRVLLRRARLFEKELNRDDEALEDYHRVLEFEYDNIDALYAICAVWRRRDDPRELAQALHRTIDNSGEKLQPEALVALYRELALLYQGTIGEPDEAIDAWRRLLKVDPNDFDAMQNLEGLLRAQERWEEVIEVKMGRAKALAEPEERIREYLEVAQLWEHRVQDADKGTPAYEAVLQIDPTHDQAFFALEKLHTAAKRAEPLIELYLARLDTREEIADKTDILRKVAKVFEEELDDKSQAFDALVTGFELDVSDNDTNKYLERITNQTNKWPELLQTVNGWLQGEKEAQRKIQLCLRLAKWYADDLNRPEYAQPYYQQVHALDPNNVAVLRQMANFYKKSGRHQEQGQMLQQAYTNALTDVDRKETLTEIGEVLHVNMGQADQGIVYYRRALEIDPYHVPALEHLERIHTERGQTAELVEVLNAKAKGLQTPEAISQTKLRAAGIYESQLSQPEKAAQVYREVLEVDAGNLAAMKGLERIYQSLSQWTELVGILEMQLDVVATERDRIEVLMKIARIQEELFVKPEVAATRLEQVVEIDPNYEPAYEALERCYRQRRQWHDLINALDRHINATLDRNKKIALWDAMAVTYATEVEDLDRAIDCYQNIVDIEPTHIPALDALAKLYEKQNDSARAIDFMTRVADLTSDGRQKVDMYYRIGRQLDEKLGDRMLAQENYERALDIDGSHQPTLAALRAIAIDAADWDRAARYLDAEQLVTDAPRVRARLLVELGKMRDEALGEHDLAIQAYELALQCDDDNEDAALPLVNEYVSRQEWPRAEPLAEMLVRKAGRRERSEQHMLNNLLGKILSAQRNYQGALKAYQTANQLDLTDQETIRGLAEVCFELGDWPSALTNFQKVLTSLEEHDSEQRAYVYYKLGRIKQAQAQPKQAINNFEKALQVDPAHRPTLDAMVQLYEQAKDWAQVCHYKRIILDNVFDGEERHRTLVEIGDIWADKDKGKTPVKAIEAYDEALDIKPSDHAVLHKQLAACQAAQQWERMVDTLQRIADIDTRVEAKMRAIRMMAQVYRDFLDDKERAVELFNQVLDLEPSALDDFERINKILTQMKDWKQLERAYRKMLHRLAGLQRDDIAGQKKSNVEFNLWHALGLIYRDRLQEKDKAIEAFRMASRMKPDDMTEHLILSELFEEAEQIDQAIEEYQAILRLDPMRVDPYRKLYTLFLTKQTYDEAWCLASALVFLRQAGDEERQFFEDYRPQGLPAVKSRLDNESWLRLLTHEDESLYLGKIFEFITPAALRAKVDQMKQKNEMPVLDARFKQDPATSTVTFARTFGWAVNVLGLPMPQLYVRSDVPGALSHVPVEPPASLAGQTVLSGFTPQDLTFIVGKHVSYYRPEHYIKAIFPTVTELTVLFFAGIKLVAPEQGVPPELSNQVIATAQSLGRYMQPVQVEGLKLAVKKFLAEDGRANIKRWAQTCELTSARAGFLLCGDLEVAKKIIAAEPQLPGDLTPQEKLKELLVFSVSEGYFKLRNQLGLAIKVGT